MQSVSSQLSAIFSQRFYSMVVTCGVVIAAFSLGASTAEATCGDYLTGDMASHDGSHRDSSNAVEEKITTDQPACPCRGLTCKRAPGKSPLPNSGFQLDQKDQGLAGLMINLPMLHQSSQFDRSTELVALPMIAFRLDRPPRV